MFELPVSRLLVAIRQPTGKEDLFLQEARASRIATALALIENLVEDAGRAPIPWRDLTVTDLEAAMLILRQMVLGNSVRAETCCQHSNCGCRVDVDFPIDTYLQNRKPRIPRGIEGPDSSGWYQLVAEDVRFRLPRCEDLLELADRAPNAQECMSLLMKRCTEPAGPSAQASRRIERAMQSIAAPLSGDLAGICPECKQQFTIQFDVMQFVIQELVSHSAGIYEDIHLLALHYKWSEEKILALPGSRRAQYVDMIRSERSAA